MPAAERRFIGHIVKNSAPARTFAGRAVRLC
jgi:hypothetical protein